MPEPVASIRALLDGPLSWYELLHEAEVTSTNDVAAQRVLQGRPPGVVVLADRQSAGRGRLERTWSDVPAGSLLCSLTVPVPPTDATLVPLVAGVAVADAVRRAGARVQLKWPNDLLSRDGRKLGGILVERHDGPAGAQLVVGVGLNLDWRGVPRGDEQEQWTSVAELTGGDVDRFAVLGDLLRGLDAWIRDLLRGTHRAVAAYTAQCATLGREVEVTTPDGALLRGTAEAITPTGALVVATVDGNLAVTAGDVVHASITG